MSKIIKMQGNRAIINCSLLEMDLTSPEFVSHQFKLLSALDKKPKTIRYEEEIIIDLKEDKTKILNEYTDIIRQFEAILIKPDIYGNKNDDNYGKRKELLRKVYSYLFTDVLHAVDILEDYKEPMPDKNIYVKGWQVFRAWVNGIVKALKKTKFYLLNKKFGGLQEAFGYLLGIQGAEYFSTSLLFMPKDAVKLKKDYKINDNIMVEFYEVADRETIIYVQRNDTLQNLDPKLKDMLRRTITKGVRERSYHSGDVRTMFEETWRELKIKFLDQAMLKGIDITPRQADVMAHEAGSWLVGLGSPIENIALDGNVTDIYIDAQNAPIYIEHSEYGICHTLWRYNEEMIETMFVNALLLSGHDRKFDENNPVVDVVVKRLNMRCHLQRPPVTFRELQAALRIMRTKPFTYPLYLHYKSMSPFFAGYDDLMVSLGSSEAVLGIKGVGKTSFTSTKISAIGTNKRILPIEDIEEMPINAYRKLGFHIGTMRVQSSEMEEVALGTRGRELDLVTIANASLRMGEACLIINEIRSRLAIQGVINILNTQPGVFILYNLHAESLKDVQDRFELVFGIPGASMFSTDRYTILIKLKFGRKERTYRVIGSQFESDFANKKFIRIFKTIRGSDIDSTKYACDFLDMRDAELNSFEKLDFTKLKKKIKFKFVPPLLKKHCETNHVEPKEYVIEAFFKGKIYDDIKRTAEKYNMPYLMEIEFVMKCNSITNKLLKENEDKKGRIDYSKVAKAWDNEFKKLLKKEKELQ